MKIITWNVNGLKARIKSGDVNKLLQQESPDLVMLQEVKCDSVNLGHNGYELILNPAEKSGFHGTGVIIKNDIRGQWKVTSYILDGHPDEGRIQLITSDKTAIVNVYVPNSGVDPKEPLRRLDYRINSWDKDFFQFLNQLGYQNVIVGGDLNVAYRNYDVHNPKTLHNKAGFTPQERNSFKNLLESGFIDQWDQLYPDSRDDQRFTFYGRFQKPVKKGWRLDYILINKNHKLNISNMSIIDNIESSDHLPLAVIY